jgi:hypothetical protein
VVRKESMLNVLWDAEPVAVLNTLRALIAVGVVFGLDLTIEQKTAVLAAAEAVLTLVTRSRVSPIEKEPGLSHPTS